MTAIEKLTKYVEEQLKRDPEYYICASWDENYDLTREEKAAILLDVLTAPRTDDKLDLEVLGDYQILL